MALYHLYIPIWLYSNPIEVRSVPMITSTLHSNLVIFQRREIHRQAAKQGSLHSNLVIFQRRYLRSTPMTSKTLHSNLVIFQPRVPGLCIRNNQVLYIPIWLYSNPPTIIPHIYRLWKLLFVDLRFSIHPTAIFFASYSYYLCLDLYYSSFIYLPIFQVYHRLTIILVQLMFYINLV